VDLFPPLLPSPRDRTGLPASSTPLDNESHKPVRRALTTSTDVISFFLGLCRAHLPVYLVFKRPPPGGHKATVLLRVDPGLHTLRGGPPPLLLEPEVLGVCRQEDVRLQLLQEIERAAEVCVDTRVRRVLRHAVA